MKPAAGVPREPPEAPTYPAGAVRGAEAVARGAEHPRALRVANPTSHAAEPHGLAAVTAAETSVSLCPALATAAARVEPPPVSVVRGGGRAVSGPLDRVSMLAGSVLAAVSQHPCALHCRSLRHAADVDAADVHAARQHLQLQVHAPHPDAGRRGREHFLAVQQRVLPSLELRPRAGEEVCELFFQAQVAVVGAPGVAFELVHTGAQGKGRHPVRCERVRARPRVALVHREHNLRPSLLVGSTQVAVAVGSDRW